MNTSYLEQGYRGDFGCVDFGQQKESNFLLLTQPPERNPAAIGFTYLIPILPLFIAWDGAVSNARTYTLEDMGELIQGLSGEKYSWDMEKLKGKGGNICIYWGSH